MDPRRTTFGLVLSVFLGATSGCAATVKQAAKEAAPAAVESSVESAHDPETRDRVAEVIADPEIRGAAAEFSQAVTDGVLNALTEEARMVRAREASDAFVDHMSRSLASSLQRDFAPAIASVVSTSVQRSLDERTEARVEALARAVARGSVQGFADAWEARLQHSAPELNGMVRRIARDAGREATLGFQEAVAASTSRQKAGQGQAGDVLAAAGRTGDSLLVALRSVGWLIVLMTVVASAAGLAWLIRRSRRSARAGGV